MNFHQKKHRNTNLCNKIIERKSSGRVISALTYSFRDGRFESTTSDIWCWIIYLISGCIPKPFLSIIVLYLISIHEENRTNITIFFLPNLYVFFLGGQGWTLELLGSDENNLSDLSRKACYSTSYMSCTKVGILYLQFQLCPQWRSKTVNQKNHRHNIWKNYLLFYRAKISFAF